MHVTIVDDSIESLETYTELLEHDFTLTALSDPHELMPSLKSNPTDLVLMDLHMPMLNGFELYELFRADYPRLPVIFLSGDGSEDKMIRAFHLGVEDYLVKPVHPNELIARIKSKIAKAIEYKSRVIKLLNLTIYLDHDLAHIDQTILLLTPTEFKILSFMAQRPNKMISKEEITSGLWPKSLGVQAINIDPHISNLRKKLGDFGCHFKTIKAKGYILSCEN